MNKETWDIIIVIGVIIILLAFFIPQLFWNNHKEPWNHD
jgi:hypothetical protein